MHTLETLFQQLTGTIPQGMEALSAAGSNRRYFRLTGGGVSVVGVEGTSVEENRAFIAMARHFHRAGLPVPQVLARSADDVYYLQEDLGDTTLFDRLAACRRTGTYGEEETALLRRTLQRLPEVQVVGARGFDFSVCYPLAEFNMRSVMWDLNYFKYCFLKATGLEFSEDRLEDDFQRLSAVLLRTDGDTFMYRDFQSRNVMVKDGEPYFIDFQGGRRGPVHYDVASFLWQARAQYPPALREELLDAYLGSLARFMPVDEADFRRRLRHFVLFRTLQVLGAYGFRGYFERKPHFLQSIPPALDNLRSLLDEDFPEYPYLADVLRQMAGLEQFRPTPSRHSLLVTVCSFSYKKGIPADGSGNGGGFVFDCRALHNPGRYEQYARLTGLDQPVIEFLERDGGILRFLEHAWALVDASVERYQARGFTHLMVCFGCTGGQHRSVYAAQRTAEHIHQQYGVDVRLLHREQGIEICPYGRD